LTLLLCLYLAIFYDIPIVKSVMMYSILVVKVVQSILLSVQTMTPVHNVMTSVHEVMMSVHDVMT